jgi:hypothetical protein
MILTSGGATGTVARAFSREAVPHAELLSAQVVAMSEPTLASPHQEQAADARTLPVGFCLPEANPPRDLKPHQQELLELYRAARASLDSVQFPNPEAVRNDLASTRGLIQMSFLLPNGEQLGSRESIGLPNPCAYPKLHEIRYSSDDKGFWLRFTAENQEGETKEAWALVFEDRSGKDAIQAFAPHQKELHDLYRTAKASLDSVQFPNPEAVRKELVNTKGQIQVSFLLPNCEQLGSRASIGLPGDCANPKLHEIRYSSDDKGFWLRFTAENQEGETKEAWALVFEEKSGNDAIQAFAPHQKELHELYRTAKTSLDSVPFPNPEAVRKDLVSDHGKLQTTFLLPNGEQLGSLMSIGLPRPCANPKLHEIRYSREDTGFWIKVSACNSAGRAKVVEFLVSEDPNHTGGEAILRTRELGRLSNGLGELPAEFRHTIALGDLRATPGRGAHGAVSSRVERRLSHEPVTFAKGEAFEQLIGVALALTYPEERIVPQFCLKVGVNPATERGFYGMRVDYRIGDTKLVEVKWGGATNNIVETYNRHKERLESDGTASKMDYQLIMLEDNQELRRSGIPFTLFSTLVEQLPEDSRELVQETQALIAQLAHEGQGAHLGLLTDYLYSALLDLREPGQGSAREGALRSVLEALVYHRRDTLRSFFEEHTKIGFNSLEANFEWQGKLYTDCIDASQYYAEHPESFEVLYSFDAWRKDSFVRLYFESSLGRDLAVAQELLCGQTQHCGSAHTIVRNPIFDFGAGVRVAAGVIPASDPRVVCVTSLVELATLICPLS